MAALKKIWRVECHDPSATMRVEVMTKTFCSGREEDTLGAYLLNEAISMMSDDLDLQEIVFTAFEEGSKLPDRRFEFKRDWACVGGEV